MAVLALVLTAGCASFPMGKSHAAKSAAFVPANHAGDASLPPHLRRVVLLPVAGGSVAPPESMAALDPIIAAALQRQNRFEVVALTREDCRRYFQLEELSSVAALPAACSPCSRPPSPRPPRRRHRRCRSRRSR